MVNMFLPVVDTFADREIPDERADEEYGAENRDSSKRTSIAVGHGDSGGSPCIHQRSLAVALLVLKQFESKAAGSAVQGDQSPVLC